MALSMCEVCLINNGKMLTVANLLEMYEKLTNTKLISPKPRWTPCFIHDLFLVLSIASMLMTLFSTYLFQAGLVEVLLRKFRGVALAGAAHVAATLALHVAWLLARWQPHHAQDLSTPALIFLFTLQRCLSPWYYFQYKRAALRVSDPRFYEDVDWISRQMQTR